MDYRNFFPNATPTRCFAASLVLIAGACGIRDETVMATCVTATENHTMAQTGSASPGFEVPARPDKTGVSLTDCSTAPESQTPTSQYSVSLSASLDGPLNSLDTMTGVLTPDYSPEISDYRLVLSYFDQNPSVILNDDRVVSVPVDVGSEATLTVTSVSQQSSRTTDISVVRDDATAVAEAVRVTDEFQRTESAFGLHVSLSDNTLAVLGSPGENRVTVYRRAENGSDPSEHWQLDARLTIRGDTVAVTDDLLVIGNTEAGGRELPGFGIGSVTVFVRQDGQWLKDTVLQPAIAAEGSLFGAALAVSGDRIAVGAPGDRSLATGINGDETPGQAYEAGAVHVFERQSGGWSRIAYLKGQFTRGGHRFGGTVAMDGNLIAVGATGDESSATGISGNEVDNGAFGAGSVTVFTDNGLGTMTQTAYLKPASVDALDGFGHAVSLHKGTLAVSALNEDGSVPGINGDTTDNNAEDSGAVTVFVLLDGQWAQQAQLKASNVDRLDQFGKAVSLQGDLLAVAATGEDGGVGGVNADAIDNSRRNGGAVYLFQRVANRWQQDGVLRPEIPESGSGFGQGLSLSGAELAVGAPFQSGPLGVSGAGVVYVYR